MSAILLVGGLLLLQVGTAGREQVRRILEAFAEAGRPLALSDVARRTGIPKSSCHAIMHTLARLGCLYSLERPRAAFPTRRVLELAQALQVADPLGEPLGLPLESLCDTVARTVLLAKREGAELMWLHVVQPRGQESSAPRVGDREALTTTAAGLALIGALKPTARDRLLGRLTLTKESSDRVREQVGLGLRRGYYVSVREDTQLLELAVTVVRGPESTAVALRGPCEPLQPKIEQLAILLASAGSGLER